MPLKTPKQKTVETDGKEKIARKRKKKINPDDLKESINQQNEALNKILSRLKEKL